MIKVNVILQFLLIFVLGIASGYLIPFDAERLKIIGDIATVVGGVATCCAAFAAIKALNSWKRQFSHAETYRLLNNLEDTFTELHKSILSYRQSVIKLAKVESHTCTPVDYNELQQIEVESKQYYFRVRDTYFDYYERLSRAIELSRYNNLHPDIVQRKVVALINGVRPIYKPENFDDNMKLLDANDGLHIKLWQEAKVDFKLLRKNC